MPIIKETDSEIVIRKERINVDLVPLWFVLALLALFCYLAGFVSSGFAELVKALLIAGLAAISLLVARSFVFRKRITFNQPPGFITVTSLLFFLSIKTGRISREDAGHVHFRQYRRVLLRWGAPGMKGIPITVTAYEVSVRPLGRIYSGVEEGVARHLERRISEFSWQTNPY